MSEVSCPKCHRNLKLDLKKSRSHTFPVYSCDCGVFGYFKVLGIELGRKTKEKLEEAEKIKEIPF